MTSLPLSLSAPRLIRLQAVLRPTWSLQCIASSSQTVSSILPVASIPTTTTSWWSVLPTIPSIESLLELIPPILWASVPKKKTSHSRKSMRSANKGLKNKTNLSLCEACGSIKLTHHVCPTCYSQISRRWKREARGEVPPLTGLGLGMGSEAAP